MHNALLSTSEQEGVALERIRIDEPTQSASNWTSASPLITGAAGTPTLPNSQALLASNPAEDVISIPKRPAFHPMEIQTKIFWNFFTNCQRRAMPLV